MDALFASLHEAAQLYGVPDLPSSLSLDRLIRFLRLAASAKEFIVHKQTPDCDLEKAPHDLPPRAHAYLAAEMGMVPQEIAALWYALGPFVWEAGGIERLQEDPQWKVYPTSPPGGLGTYFKHIQSTSTADSPAYNGPLLGFRMLYPPVRVCDRTYCPQRQLLRHARYRKGFRDVSLFTLDQGVCDAFAVNLVCPSTSPLGFESHRSGADCLIRLWYNLLCQLRRP